MKKLLLFIACVIVGILGYQDSYITSLSVTSAIPKTKESFAILPSAPYKGQFTASYDRLGIVKIRITTGGRLNSNRIVFRLREAGQKNWLVENTYVTDRFVDGQQYPFGFPVIEHSKGKSYEYELTAIDGSGNNTISIVPGLYAMSTQYIYSKNMVNSWFLTEKTKELFGSVPHIGYWIMCLLPLLFFTNLYLSAAILMIILYGMLPMQIHSNMILWIGFLIVGTSFYKKNAAFPFVLAGITITLSLLTYLMGTYDMAAKFATIVPLLLVSGGITIWKSGF